MIVAEDMLYRAALPLDKKNRITDLTKLRYIENGQQSQYPKGIVVPNSNEPLHPRNVYDGLTTVYCNPTTGAVTEYVYNSKNSFDDVTGKWRLKGSIIEVTKLPSTLSDINKNVIYRLTESEYDTTDPTKLIHPAGLYMYNMATSTWNNLGKSTKVVLTKPLASSASLDLEYLYQVENAEYKNTTRIAAYLFSGQATITSGTKYAIKCDSVKLPIFNSTPYKDKWFVFTPSISFTMSVADGDHLLCLGSYSDNTYTKGTVYWVHRATDANGMQVDTLHKLHTNPYVSIVDSKPFDATEVTPETIFKYASTKRTAQCYNIYLNSGTNSSTHVKINVNGVEYYGELESSLKGYKDYVMLADRYTEKFFMMEKKTYEYETGKYIELHHIEMMGDIKTNPESGVVYEPLIVTGYDPLGIWTSTLYTKGTDNVIYDITYQLGDSVGRELGGETFADGLKVVKSVGLLDIGYDLGTKSPLQVLKDMLYKPITATCVGNLVNKSESTWASFPFDGDSSFGFTNIEYTCDVGFEFYVKPTTYNVKKVETRIYSGANTLSLGSETYTTPKSDEFKFTCLEDKKIISYDYDTATYDLKEESAGKGFVFEIKITDVENNVKVVTFDINVAYIIGSYSVSTTSYSIYNDNPNITYTTTNDTEKLSIKLKKAYDKTGVITQHGEVLPFSDFFTRDEVSTVDGVEYWIYEMNDGAKVANYTLTLY